MKSFFKKISLVLVLAMVVTMMPTNLRVASAADGPQMYSTLKFYLGGDETGKYSDEPRYAKTWNKDGYDVVGQFVSSNPEVAKVNSKGRVTPLAVGTTTITATFKSTTGGEDVIRECVVTVKKNAVEAGISENSAATLEKGLEVGKTFQTVTYRTDADGETSWKGTDKITSPARFTSSDETVFTVTKKGGFIKAVGIGEATLKVWAVQSESPIKDEDGNVVEYLPVTPVKEYTVKVVAAEPDVVTYDRAKLTIGNEKLTADGVSGTLVTFTLYSGPDLIDTETKDVQVRLETTYGTLAFTNVTLENGTATVLYTTPILNKEAVARITAIIVSAENTEEGHALINTQAAPVDIQLVPPTGEGTIVDDSGANVVGSTVVTADRITLYFNKSVKREDFMYLDGGNYKVSKDGQYRFTLDIDDNIPQTQTNMVTADFDRTDIVDILQNTDTSLTFVLKDGEKHDHVDRVFTDNSRYALNFVDRSKNGVVTSNGVIGYVTDAILPSMLSVAQHNGSMTTILVTFSEPMPEFTASQVVIDGVALNGAYAQDRWGVAAHRATVTRLGGTENNSRNAYLITLGQDANGEQIYFPAGRHSLTINNVGDYAYATDKSNFISTATLDFNIIANEVVPTYTVEVQSPEQYLVQFNCEVTVNTADLKLQYYNTNANQWQEVTGLGQNYDVVNLGTKDGKTQILVEVKNDWTRILGDKNYYNYNFRIHADKDKIKNVANGKRNEEVNFELTDAKMKTVDAISPSIVGEVKEVTTGTKFEVTFDEPIQFSKNGTTAGVGNAGNITPSRAQNLSGAGVPIITAQMVAKDLSKTVDASITNIDRQNYTLTIETAVALDPGKEYILYVRSVSDDIGNTSLTLSKEFTTNGAAPVVTKFMIAGVWADANLQADGIYNLNTVASDVAGQNLDAIYVEFTSEFATAGGVKTVLTTTNWSINGYPLPAGSYIIGNIIGDSRLTGVTIVLPHGTIANIAATVVTLSRNVEDKNGNPLEGENRIVTQYRTATSSAGSNNALSSNRDYVGKIGRFAAANPDNNIGVTGVTGNVVKTTTGSAVSVTVTGVTGVTSEKIKNSSGADINVVAGYKVVVYGVDSQNRRTKIAEITKSVASDQPVITTFTVGFELGKNSDNTYATDSYTKYRVEVTAIAATEYGNSNTRGIDDLVFTVE